MTYLVKNGAWSGLNFFVTSVLGVAVAVVAANVLDKETYGIYRYALSLVGLASSLSLTGMNTAVARAVARGDDGILRKVVRAQAVWNSLSGALMFAIAAYLYVRGNTLLALSMAILGVTVPPAWALNTYTAFLSGKKDFKTATRFSIVNTALYSIAMALSMLLFRSVIGLVVVYGLSNLLLTAYFYWRTLRIYAPVEGQSQAYAEAWGFGKHLSVINVLSLVAQQCDNVVVFHYVGAGQLATYTFASLMPDRIKKFAKNISATISPKIANKDANSLERSLFLRFFQLACAGLLAATVYIVAAPIVFRWLFPQYLSALHYSQIISLNLIFWVPMTYGAYVAQAQKMIRPLYVSGTVTSIFRIVSIVAGVTFGGLLGVILAKLASNGIVAINGMFFLRNELRRLDHSNRSLTTFVPETSDEDAARIR
jgi:O-antigen/teichoic acid export membrane protein